MTDIILDDINVEDYNKFITSLNEIDPEYLEVYKEFERIEKENNH